ncbi:MAG: D-alanine--D-alanine ligase [Flavobacteriaceae bacterium]|nr:D-alanine--D-alanine ligase [Flavobacteriaceae bacterium]
MKKNIAIIMGGYSSEVEISMMSGEVVHKHLNKNKYNIYNVHILKDKWVAVLDNVEYPIDKGDFSFTHHENKISFDCVFNAIHGHPGEDGTILAYFELLGIKHTSAPFYQMALTFNKRDTLSVVRHYGIKAANSVYLDNSDAIDEDEIIKKVGLPCFVKPNNAGSSFGISKVSQQRYLKEAINYAFAEDNEILIESFLDGIEVSIGVLDYQGEIIVLPATEIVSHNDFFDYEAKYLGASKEITPARISKKQLQRLNSTAKEVYEILNLSGFSRAEYIFIEDEPYFLEINTVPGLTEASLLPQQAKAGGITLENLFGNAIETALKKKS